MAASQGEPPVPSKTGDTAPKYQVIANALRAAIIAGEYSPGDQVPGENALMERYKVARMTARQALGVLKRSGMISSHKGQGSFVLPSAVEPSFRPITRRGIERLHHDWRTPTSIWASEAAGRSLDVDQLKVSREAASPDVAEALELPKDAPLVVRSRRYLLDGQPVLLSVSRLPADIAEDTPIAQPNPGEGGIYARLADLGHEPTYFRETVRTQLPTDEQVARLKGSPTEPVFLIRRTAYTDGGRPVEINDMVLDARVYVLEYAFRRKSTHAVDD
jgi:GntR family transcriptional regulator